MILWSQVIRKIPSPTSDKLPVPRGPKADPIPEGEICEIRILTERDGESATNATYAATRNCRHG